MNRDGEGVWEESIAQHLGQDAGLGQVAREGWRCGFWETHGVLAQGAAAG